jgi:hypothetical protein
MAPYVTVGVDWARWGGAWLVRFETLFRPFAGLRALATQIVPLALFAEPSARRCLPFNLRKIRNCQCRRANAIEEFQAIFAE